MIETNIPMLDLVEHTNGDIVMLMFIAFTLGFIFAVTLLYIPAQTKLDTIRRNWDREERAQLWKRTKPAEAARDYPII